MRFKQFLESVQGSLKRGDIVIAMDDIRIFNTRSDTPVPETWANKGQLMEFIEEDKPRELVYFWAVYEDGVRSHNKWYADSSDFYANVKTKRDADKDFLKGLVDEAVSTSTLPVGQHVFVVKQITGTAEDNGHRTPFWWGDELEFMGFEEASGRVIAHAFSEEEQETYTYFFDDVEFRDSVVMPDEFKKLRRQRDARFLKGLIDDDDVKEDFDFRKMRIGTKFKVQTPFSARETEVGKIFHFARGEDVEFAGSKPWKNGRIVYFFGKKNEYGDHMFELPETLFDRAVVPAERFMKEDHAPEPVHIGQTRVIMDPIIGVRNGRLHTFDPGTKIKIIHKEMRRSQSDPKDIFGVVTFTHENHGDTDFDYIENEIARTTLTPEEKKKRDRGFLDGLKESEDKFKVGDKVYMKKTVHGVVPGTEQAAVAPADGMYQFHGYQDGQALLAFRWRKNPTISVPIKDFLDSALTQREYHMDFMNGLKEEVGKVYVVTNLQVSLNRDGIPISAVDDGESAEIYKGDIVKVVADDGEWLTIEISDASLDTIGAKAADFNAKRWHVSKRRFYKAVTLKSQIDREFFKGLIDKDE